jgi:hypothetical protein
MDFMLYGSPNSQKETRSRFQVVLVVVVGFRLTIMNGSADWVQEEQVE